MCSRKSENKTLKILLKIFLVVGIVAGICIIAKILLDRFRKKSAIDEDEDDFVCDFECLENDELDGNCDTCIYNEAGKCAVGDGEEEAVTEAADDAE